eukprot:Nitzschia sp. Nitz4//scaffold248_size28759//9082//9339//NITZ4_008107-RA/size28759-exonerate_est2genome-gene-0.3-mRNA-1//-1//CDS//3329543986//427//frame0
MDAMRRPFSEEHALQWQELCSQVHPPSAVMNQPIIPTSQTLEETATAPAPELRGDVAVRGHPRNYCRETIPHQSIWGLRNRPVFD